MHSEAYSFLKKKGGGGSGKGSPESPEIGNARLHIIRWIQEEEFGAVLPDFPAAALIPRYSANPRCGREVQFPLLTKRDQI